MTNNKETSKSTMWQQLALAMLTGFIFESVLVVFVAVSQPPMATPPINAIPIFIVVATIASTAVPLIYWKNKYGYIIGILAGVGGLIHIIAIVTEQYGPLADVNPLGPFLYLLLGLGSLITSWNAKRYHTD